MATWQMDEWDLGVEDDPGDLLLARAIAGFIDEYPSGNRADLQRFRAAHPEFPAGILREMLILNIVDDLLEPWVRNFSSMLHGPKDYELFEDS